MPLGHFEAIILRSIARNRNPESHVAGATILNQSPDSPRASEDIDIFHDTKEALDHALAKDVALLGSEGFEVQVVFDKENFKRAIVRRDGLQSKVEWVHDSAFRFYPVEPDQELGYRLNFWDAATNKVLAAAFRTAIRDYIDLLEIHQHKLSLGALVWAAAGKDDGLSPTFIVEELARTQRYPAPAYDEVRFSRPVDPKALKRIWLAALEEARVLCSETLLDAPYGCFFLDATGQPVTPTLETLPQLKPHFGSLRGCWPRIAEDA